MLQPTDLTGLAGDIILRKSRWRDESIDEIFHFHRPRLEELAAQHNLSVTVHQEIVSGAKVMKPGALMDQVIRKTDAGLSRVWIAMDIDRLARPNWLEMGRIMDCIERNQVYILTPQRVYDPASAGDELVAMIQLIFARHEYRKYRDRVLPVRDDIVRKESRYSNGAAPFGYVWDKEAKAYGIDPARYPVVEYAWSLVGRHGAATVRRLVAERFGDPMLTAGGYDAMFHNPFYAGYPCGRKQHEHHSRKEGPHWVWPEQRAGYPCPVTLEQWREIQTAIVRRAFERPKTSADTWARGVLWFGDCGTRAHGAGTVYRCDEVPALKRRKAEEDARVRSGGFVGAVHSIKKAKVHRVLEALIEHVLSNPQSIGVLADQCRAMLDEREGSHAEITRRLVQTSDTINRKEDQLRRLMSAYSADLSQHAANVFQQQLREWEREVELLKAEHADLCGRLTMPAVTPELVDALASLVGEFRSWWPALPPVEKKAIAEMIFRRVTISHNRGRRPVDPAELDLLPGSDESPGGQCSIAEILWQDWCLSAVPPPPASLQSEIGARAMRIALRSLRTGEPVTRRAFDAELGASEYHCKALRTLCRRWLNIW